MATMRALPRPILPTTPSIPGGIAVHRSLSAGAASLSFQVAHLRRRHFELSATLRSPFAASRSFATIFSSLRSNTAGIGEAVAGRREGWAAVAALLVAAVVSLFVPPAARASPPEAEEVAFVKRTVSSHGIVIFSKTYCPFCSNAKAVFKELKKVPHVVELDQREDGQDIQDALNMIVGRWTVPQVFINGKHIGGSDDTVEAYESGMLVKLLCINSDGDL